MNEEQIKALAALFIEMAQHLDYCGYGDSYERECAREDKLPQRVDAMREIVEKFLEDNG